MAAQSAAFSGPPASDRQSNNLLKRWEGLDLPPIEITQPTPRAATPPFLTALSAEDLALVHAAPLQTVEPGELMSSPDHLLLIREGLCELTLDFPHAPLPFPFPISNPPKPLAGAISVCLFGPGSLANVLSNSLPFPEPPPALRCVSVTPVVYSAVPPDVWARYRASHLDLLADALLCDPALAPAVAPVALQSPNPRHQALALLWGQFLSYVDWVGGLLSKEQFFDILKAVAALPVVTDAAVARLFSDAPCPAVLSFANVAHMVASVGGGDSVKVLTGGFSSPARPEADPDTQFLLLEPAVRGRSFPHEVIIVFGAPGAGKSIASDEIRTRMSFQVIETSNVLSKRPDFSQIKAFMESGRLVPDRLVAESIFLELSMASSSRGAVLDGFPRTSLQAELFLRLLDRLASLRELTPPPRVSVIVLTLSGTLSVERQLARGFSCLQNNRRFAEDGIGQAVKVRSSDIIPDLARRRFEVFQAETRAALAVLKRANIPVRFVDGEQPEPEVRAQIHLFLRQTVAALPPQVDAFLRPFRSADALALSPTELVKRLNSYMASPPDRALFERVVAVLEREFEHILRQQASCGRAVLRTANPVFFDPVATPEAVRGPLAGVNRVALQMALDVLSHKQFVVSVELKRGGGVGGEDVLRFKVTFSEGKRSD